MTIIRPAALEDAEHIARVHIDTWLTTYRGLMPDDVLNRRSLEEAKKRWDASLRQPKRTSTIVAEQAAQIVGFASFGPELGTDRRYQGEIYALYILETHQHQGIGRMLMRAAAEGLLQHNYPNMLLWVLSTNPARGFYEKLGGKHLRERTVEFNGAPLRESAYGWADLTCLLDGR